jgi:hypothetical protein
VFGTCMRRSADGFFWAPSLPNMLLNVANSIDDPALTASQEISVETIEQLHALASFVVPKIGEFHKQFILLNQYLESRLLPERSTFRILSLMSLVEGVLSHKPKPTDPTESVTRQVSRKFDLISTTTEGVDAKLHFPAIPSSVDTVKLWQKLYEIRSQIAHGEDFRSPASAEYLDTPHSVSSYLDAALRLLFREWFRKATFVEKIRAI